MTPTIQDPPGEHTHEIVMDREKFIRMYRGGETIEVVTSFQHNHAHTLRLRYVASTNRWDFQEFIHHVVTEKRRYIVNAGFQISAFVGPMGFRFSLTMGQIGPKCDFFRSGFSTNLI